jgi:peptide/nickel transport system permease protein
MFGVSVIVFAVMHLVPGDIVDALLGPDATLDPAARATLRRILGVDTPVYIQYFHWLGGILHGDLGVSLATQDSVVSILLRALPITMELAVFSTLLAIAVALPLGIISAIRPYGWLSAAVRFLGLLGLSIPNFWLATILILATSVYFGWSPALIYIPFFSDPLGNLRQMLLPILSLSVTLIAVVMRMTRSSMLEVLGQDYMRTARAKGLWEMTIIMRHGLKNALIPVITVIGIQFGYLLGGTVVIEQIFGLPGLGWILLGAISQRDYPVIQGGVLVITMAFILVNLLVDLLYARLDPRIKYG